MKYLQLTWFHFKRIVFQSDSFLVLTFVVPLVMICGLNFVFSSDSSASLGDPFAVVNHSDWVMENVYPQLESGQQEMFYDDADEAFRQLEQAEISLVYEIPENFPESIELIQAYSLNGSNSDSFFEQDFTAAMIQALADSLIEAEGIIWASQTVASPTVLNLTTPVDARLSMSIFMIVFFMSYACGIIASDLSKLRADQVLKRSIVTNASSPLILGSVLTAFSLYNFISAFLVIAIVSLIFSIPITQISLIISALLAFCIFTVGLTMLLFRIIKNISLIQIVGVIVTILLVFIGLGIFEGPILGSLSYLSPFYWLLEALDTGIIWKNIPIIVLYGLVLFTAGSFKVERMVQKRV